MNPFLIGALAFAVLGILTEVTKPKEEPQKTLPKPKKKKKKVTPKPDTQRPEKTPVTNPETPAPETAPDLVVESDSAADDGGIE